MKKPTPELRERLIRAALRELKKKRDQRGGESRAFGEWVREQNAEYLRPLPFTTSVRVVEIAGELDLLARPKATLKALKDLFEPEEPSAPPMRVVVNMARVTRIDGPSLLFLCSRIHQISMRPLHYIAGTYPDDPEARKAMIDAGFPEFLGMSARPPKGDYADLSLRKSTDFPDGRVNLETASKIRGFLLQRHPDFTVEESDLLYPAVLECLENVRLHAYPRSATRRRGWYAVGLHDQQSCTSTIAILDVGIGVLQSIRGRPGSQAPVSDAQLLDEACSGRQTASGLRHRGQGLKFIRKFAETRPGRRFHVLTGGTMVTFQHGTAQMTRRIPKRAGTIVVVEICSQGKQ